MVFQPLQGSWIGYSTKDQIESGWCDPSQASPDCFPFPGVWHGECASNYVNWASGEQNKYLYPYKIGKNCVVMSQVKSGALIGTVPIQPKWNDEACNKDHFCTCSHS